MNAPEDGDVALKLLHTADWHLGRGFPTFDPYDERELMRARMGVIDEIFALAERHGVDAVLCAGDLFDTPEPDPVWWRELAGKLQRADPQRPIVLLPGNHDPVRQGSVWDRAHPFRAELPAWVHVVDRDDFTLELGEHAIVYGVPCHNTAGGDDPTSRIPERAAGDDRIRIGLVHGSTFEMPEFRTNFPIDRDAARARGLDYLAIGDTHAFREYEPREHPTVYPSAPEATSFDERDTGYVALVLFPKRPRPAIIRKERVGRFRWDDRTVTDLGALRALLDEPDLQRVVLRLRLRLRVSPGEHDEVDALLEKLRGSESRHGRVAALQVDRSELRLDTASMEATSADLPDVLRRTVARLRELEDDPQQGERARRALHHLHRVIREQ